MEARIGSASRAASPAWRCWRWSPSAWVGDGIGELRLGSGGRAGLPERLRALVSYSPPYGLLSRHQVADPAALASLNAGVRPGRRVFVITYKCMPRDWNAGSYEQVSAP